MGVALRTAGRARGGPDPADMAQRRSAAAGPSLIQVTRNVMKRRPPRPPRPLPPVTECGGRPPM